jgi:asparagine synthetase B (glutamine-hydrolysing)
MTTIDLRESVETLSRSPAASFLAVFRPALDRRPARLELLSGEGQSAWLARDEGCTVVLSGELVDRSMLAAAAGVDPAGNDAELVLAAYRRLGEGLFDEIRGFFSVAIHDVSAETLLFLRDHLGHNSFFYAEGRDGLYLSDSIQRLARHDQVPATVKRTVVAELLIHRTRSVDDTGFEAIHRVRSGWVYRVKGANREASRYWFPLAPDGSTQWAKEDELVEFEPLLKQAVDRTVEAGATGIFLSGGLDSVTVAMHATDLLSSRGDPLPLALSLVFPDYEEIEVQKNVAATLGLEQELIPYEEATGPDSLVMSAVRTSGTWPMPLVNLWQPLYTHLALRGRARGMNRVLTGAGGDEWLQVSPLWGFSRLRRLHLGQMRHLYRTYLQSSNLEPGPLLKNLLWKYGLEHTLRRTAKSTLHTVAPGVGARIKIRNFRNARPAWLAPDPSLAAEVERRAGALKPIDYSGVRFDKLTVPYLENAIGAMETEEAFERGRRIGVSTYMPFWDPDLDRFLARVPPDLMNQNYWAKGLVRGPLAERFPDAGFDRQKKILSTVLSTRLTVAQIPDAWREMGGVSALAQVGIVDEKVLQSDIERRLSVLKRPEGVEGDGVLQRAIAAHAIWTVLNVESWLRQWV